MLIDIIEESGWYQWVVEDIKRKAKPLEWWEGYWQGCLEADQNILAMLAEQSFIKLSDTTRLQIVATTDAGCLKEAILALATMPDEAALVAFLQTPQNGPATAE